jgi:flagellar biosynthesis/type III secretory pathway protein FliH
MEEDMVNIFKSAFDNGKTYDDSKPLHSKRHPIYIEGQEVTGLSLYGEPPEKGYRCAKCGEYISERDKDATIEYLYKVIKEKEQELDKAREEGFNEGVKEAEESEQIQADWDMEELENIVNRIVEKLDKFNNK